MIIIPIVSDYQDWLVVQQWIFDGVLPADTKDPVKQKSRLREKARLIDEDNRRRDAEASALVKTCQTLDKPQAKTRCQPNTKKTAKVKKSFFLSVLLVTKFHVETSET